MRWNALLVASLALGMASAPAGATTIAFHFAATQTSAQTPGGLASLAAPHASITGSFSYDTAVPASSSTATDATYPTGALSVDQFDVGTGAFSAPITVFVIASPGSDLDVFQIATGGSSPGLAPGIYDVASLSLHGKHVTLASPALPLSLSLVPGVFDGRISFQRFEILAGGGFSFLGTTNYSLTSLTAAVPEPASAALVALGLLGLGVRRRRTR